MRLSNSKILVTGSDGFIGSHLTEELVRRGHKVRAFVQYNSFNSWGWLEHSSNDIKQALEIFPGDVRDPNGVRQAMQGCDVVFHLAALIAIPFSYHSPDSYVDTNIKGTLNVLQAARQLGTARVLHTSTSEVYGTARFVPITEEHPLQGQSPYSATKIAADQLALSFYRSFETPVCVVRPFNTFGPRQSARAIIPTVITQLAGGQRELSLGSLSPMRDFSFVSDIVRGFIAVAESDKSIGEVINLGSGHEISIHDTAKTIAKLMNIEMTIRTEQERVRPKASEVDRLLACTSKAQELTGWRPHYHGREGFERGLSETISWFRDSTNLSRYKANIYNV